MAKETTFSIIKPNAVKKGVIGDIIAQFEKEGLTIAAAKLTVLSRKKCEEFYAEHKERPFFGELVDFMTSGPVMLIIYRLLNKACFLYPLIQLRFPQSHFAAQMIDGYCQNS